MRSKKNLFEDNKIYFFTPDGRLISAKEADDTSIRMAKIKQAMKQNEDGSMTEIPAPPKLIFRPTPPFSTTWFAKIGLWIEGKVPGIGKERVKVPYIHRYHRIHVIAKNWIFKKSFFILKRVLDKYMVKSVEDIPTDSYNNHLRMFYVNWEKALGDTFSGIPYDQETGRQEAKAFGTKEEYMKWMKDTKYWSYDNRISIINLWMTMILEDTFDREWVNQFMLRNYWTMYDHYKGQVPLPGDLPIYRAVTANNEPFFERWSKLPSWEYRVKDRCDVRLDILEKKRKELKKHKKILTKNLQSEFEEIRQKFSDREDKEIQDKINEIDKKYEGVQVEVDKEGNSKFIYLDKDKEKGEAEEKVSKTKKK